MKRTEIETDDGHEEIYEGAPEEVSRSVGEKQDDFVESEDGVSEDDSSAVKR